MTHPVWPAEVMELIARGIIETDRADARFYGRLAARFPMGFNRIDWSRVPGARAAHRSVVMQVGFDHEVTFQDCRVDVAEFLDRVIESLGLPPEEKVVFLGDGADTALWLPVAVLREHFSSLFQAPQHYYVHPPDAGWCLNYTFEDDLYFGHAVWQEGRKPRRVR